MLDDQISQAINNLARAVHGIESKLGKMTDKGSIGQQEWEKSQPLIHSSFESWRDYLYKFSLAIGAALGFLITFISSKWTQTGLDSGTVNLGLLLIAISVLVSFLLIFISLYLERLFLSAHVEFARCMDVGYGNERGTITNPIVCVELTLREHLAERLEKFHKLTNPHTIREERQGIKLDRRNIRLMKYVGLKFTKYEHVRLIGTLAIFSLSFAGFYLIATELLTSQS